MPRKYFGTDGVRGRVGAYPITPEFVMKLGWAAGKVFAQQGKSRILIGKDTRISGYMFESALEAGLSSAGVDIGLLGPIPTPGIAYLTRTFRAQAGIVISASHNPYYDNGIKFFSGNGEKLPDETELAIESWLDKPMSCVESAQLGKAVRINDAAGRYIEFCKGTVSSLNLRGLKIVLDCAHGATYQIAPAVFAELGATVITIGAQPDGLNINEGVGSTEPEALQARVLQEQADLGIAFDGDGDRVMMVDHRGELVDGDQLLFIIATHAKNQGRLNGGVVGTLMSNLGLELGLKDLGVDFLRAKVGDRYVMQMLNENGWRFGGESSGHLLCLDANTTGDGIVAALQVLQALKDSGTSLHEWQKRMSKMPQVMINVQRSRQADVMSLPEIIQAIAATEEKLASRGRVLLRPSGTEPVVRVMVEGEDAVLVQTLAEELAAVVEQALA
ncbi:phosphoglucosamine mutase [Thalassolituus alkanivorans]|jgi:phosphoglucosamine mutase|uniref:phosphoglucosamine mutase n=1 Tax=Thalassolituus alkanivorans TaxID=2881055 RepID=UPI001E508227|nr:phosphoglucosamine mutase [Thalassolituus alkanivorans]MCB2386326.1 phosphoglucosamine mutase [Thalassolituus alkanivorans]MCB2422073.1 phosphoglucosamine mutase [Thalassolituus alkanivorans]